MAVKNLYLVDQSALARVPRHPAVQGALERLDDVGVLATTSIIDLEIGYSARHLAEFDSVDADRRSLYHDLPLTRVITDRARHVQRELVKRGQHRGPGPSDLLIAAVAETFGAILVHYDRDFDVIAKVTGQPAQWIVPAGSVA
jgi:predicted nucleic acid-binding protein